MKPNTVPICGTSDHRNKQYFANYSLRKFWNLLIYKNAPLVLDVGAHRGESIKYFKNIFPAAKIFSFEPDPDNFRELERYIRLNNKYTKQTKVFPMAVTEKMGTKTFYRQKITHLGGLKPINSVSKDSLGYASQAANKPIQVPATSVDSFCRKNRILQIDVLKIDAQGCEAEVLRGAAKMLFKTQICVVEISLYDFYDEGTCFLDLEKHLIPAGLRLWDFSKISKNPKSFRTDWVEAIYCRKK